MDSTSKIPESWKEFLNPSQIEAIETINGPVLIMAGAGSGKTRVLTHRYAHLVRNQNIDVENILAITFTNKAAEEMKIRISELLNLKISPRWISTFHSLCVKILRVDGNKIGYNNNFTIYDQLDTVKVVRLCMSENGLDTKQYSPKKIRGHISNLKNEMRLPAEALQNAESFFDVKVAEIYSSYEKKLILANAMDFDDLLLKTVDLLNTNETVLKKWSRKFQFIMVDEYQDTNHVQYKLVELLASDNKNICVVGDSDQSIYAFRGANIRNILEFEKDFNNAKIIQLDKNYRSTKKILNLANSIISNNDRKIEKNLWTDNEDGLDISSIKFRSEKDEAKWVAEEIRNIISQDQSAEVAIFYRTNSQSRLFEEELRKINLNYKLVGSVGFYERKEIKDIVAYLQFLINDLDTVSFERIVNEPRRGIGETTKKKIRNYMDENNKSVIETLDSLYDFKNLSNRVISNLLDFKDLIDELKTYALEGPSKTIEKILDLTGYKSNLIKEGTLEAQMRLENIEELLNSAFSFENLYDEDIEEPYSKLRDYLQSIALFSDTDKLEDSDKILLMTLHNAKGLEFPFVFMTGMEENLFPHERSSQGDSSEIEEERRLCYVGVTRAEQKLYLTHSWSRTLWGGTVYNLPSRFLEEGANHFITEDHTNEFTNNSDSQNLGEVGKVVIHEKYGEGVIKEVNGNEITVEFSEDVGTKYLDVEWAPIKFQ